MPNITYRLPTPVAPGSTTFKSSPLTNAEIDGNFKSLNDSVDLKANIASPTFTGSVTIPGGTINNAIIGGTTRASGAFTTLAANGAVTLTAGTASTSTETGTLVVTGGIGVSGNVYGNAFYGSGAGLTTGTVPVVALNGLVTIAKGGTNSTTTPTNGGVTYGTGTAYAFTLAGSSGQVLRSNGAAAPTWVDLPSGVTLEASTSASTFYPVFATGTGSFATGYIKTAATALSYVPSTGALTAVSFTGSGANLTSLDAGNLSSGTISSARGVLSGSASASFVRYNGTTKLNGAFDGGTTAPNGSTRLNYDGYLYATRLYGDVYGSGANLTGTASSLTAGSSTNSAVTNDTTTNSTHPVTFISAAGSSATLKSGSVTINPSTGALAATSFTGAGTGLTGTASSLSVNYATSATTANAVNTGNGYQMARLGVGTAPSDTTGEIRATNNVTAYYSDERLKDFAGTIPNALEKVLSLNGYYFTENDLAKTLGYDNDRRQVGVSAQEVEAVLPEVVTEAPIDNKYKTVWYDKLVPLLIEAIKEQQVQIEELKALIRG